MTAGRLSVVATPIGHLDDITLRALTVLREADLVAAEDTRAAATLLAHHGLKRPLVSYFDANEKTRTAQLLARLQSGAHIALICQAGTPTISDPGYRLITEASRAGIRVEPIPGPSAAMAALSISGLPSDQFVFLGFLARTSSRRRKELGLWKSVAATLIFYEAPHRLEASLDDMIAIFGADRRAVVGREMTKLHEEIVRGTLSDIKAHFLSSQIRGEITIVVEGSAREPLAVTAETIEQEVTRRLIAGESPSAVARSIAEALSLSKREVYQTALRVSKSMDKANTGPREPSSR